MNDQHNSGFPARLDAVLFAAQLRPGPRTSLVTSVPQSCSRTSVRCVKGSLTSNAFGYWFSGRSDVVLSHAGIGSVERQMRGLERWVDLEDPRKPRQKQHHHPKGKDNFRKALLDGFHFGGHIKDPSRCQHWPMDIKFLFSQDPQWVIV